MEIALCDLTVGQGGTVVSVNAKGDILRRLLDIGIVDGTEIKCVLKSPLGDPTAFLIRGAVIALRKEDSINIMVKSEFPSLVVRDNGPYCTIGRNKRYRNWFYG